MTNGELDFIEKREEGAAPDGATEGIGSDKKQSGPEKRRAAMNVQARDAASGGVLY